MSDEGERLHKCGFCMTGHHYRCAVSTTWYGQTWLCQCDCRKEAA